MAKQQRAAFIFITVTLFTKSDKNLLRNGDILNSLDRFQVWKETKTSTVKDNGM